MPSGSLKIAAVYCIYNEEEYIEHSIRSIYDSVDKIVILMGTQPWSAYNPTVRSQFSENDATESIVDRLASERPKIVVKKGVWDSEVAQRQDGMDYCIENGFDYYFLVDGDEVYRKDHLDFIRREVQAHPEVGTFYIKCTVLWRSFKYRIPYWGVQWVPSRIFRIARSKNILGFKFPFRSRITGPNEANSPGPSYLIPPHQAVFYHFGFARTEQRMRLKIAASEQQHRFIKGWLNDIWLKWPEDRSMKNLQQLDPEGLPEALYVDPSDLPDTLKEHPYWDMEIIR